MFAREPLTAQKQAPDDRGTLFGDSDIELV